MAEPQTPSSTRPSSLETIESFLRATGTSTQPAVIWYGPGQQRIELSGKVLENWVAKTANLLTEELDAEPGSTLRMGAPLHWRSLAVALAALRTGCTFVGPGYDAPQLWVGFDHSEEAERAEIPVYLGRGALAMTYDGDTSSWSPDAVDYCASIRSFADSYDPLEVVPPETVVDSTTRSTMKDMLDAAASWAQRTHERAGDAKAVLIRPDGAALDTATLARCAGIIASDRAVVLVEPEVAEDPDSLHAILSEEHAVSD